VLIRGESGVGKELVARAIHQHSPRSRAPYVAVNIAAIPAEMAASALFGHARGAFTGAIGKSDGFFGQAERGTLFLDEIAEAPRRVQALLLRAVREGEIQAVGETEPRKSDVRLVTATDADLEAMGERGDFLPPLLRRIEAYTIHVPPLRERRDDIARLFFRFLNAELGKLGELDKLEHRETDKKPWVPVSLVQALLAYSWPGNVAELQTVVRRIALINRGSRRLQLDSWLTERLRPVTKVEVEVVAAERQQATRRATDTLDDADIVRAMRDCQFKVIAAARRLGVSRSWLHTRLEFCAGLRKAKDISEIEIREAAGQSAGSTEQMAALLEVSEHGLKLRMHALGL
jgi:two-component system nitrogen regulation response regulator GlnG